MCTTFVRVTLCLILLAQPLAASAEAKETAQPYIMGVFPFVPASNVEGIFAPLAAELSQSLGRPVKVRSASSFDKFTEALKNRDFDLAFIQPFDYAALSKPAKLLPLASRNETLNSYIVVRNDSPVRAMKDLKGKTIGMPPKAAAVSFLNSVAAKKAGLTPGKDVTFVFLDSHQACLQQLAIGNVAACGVSPATVRLAESQLKTTFRLLKKSPAIPAPLFVVKKELPQKDRDTMQRVLITTDLAGVSPGLRNSFVTKGQKPFRKTTDGEYDVVRAMMNAYNLR